MWIFAARSAVVGQGQRWGLLRRLRDGLQTPVLASALALSIVVLAMTARASLERRLESDELARQGFRSEWKRWDALGKMKAPTGAGALSNPASHQRLQVQALLNSVQVAASARGVSLVSAGTTIAPASTLQTPGHAEVALTLRGSYRELRTTLGEMLDRNDTAVLQRLVINRSGAPDQLEAQVSLLLAVRSPASASRGSSGAR